MEDAEQEGIEQVRDWIGRLEVFAAALDDIEGDDATDFCDGALDAWQNIGLPSVTHAGPQALVVFEALNALARVGTAAAMDWADTPDVRDRYTRDSAQQLVSDALDDVISECKCWLSEGLPPADEIKHRFTTVAGELKKSMQVLGEKNAELDAQDAEAEADQYGAILLHRDPSRSDAPIFEKVCSFTEEENARYVDAYNRIRRMLDCELLQHISDESDRLCDVLMDVLSELQKNQGLLRHSAAMAERRRKLRSALISFTAALQIHEYQTIRSARRTLGLDRSEVDKIKALFAELKETSFDYRWLEALRDALQHGDIDAFKWRFSISIDAEPAVTITMDRAFMLEFHNDNRTKPWLKRRELEELDSDPNVLDMIKGVQPLMGALQKKLDAVLYSNVAEDAATVKELIGRFDGREGMYFLQTGPGFTRRKLAPPQMPLEPHVLNFAYTYTPEEASDAARGS
ncbi:MULTISPECIES: hypothetical protein [Mycobacterium]|uniref:Uncharacterized protein n=1 Tax=Mycobacterium colombiense TaxID=339268 RepID=A0A329LYK8_9MYCO|nr:MULTISPECIES: hypothetical protein [Mycobacterium]MDM4141922.1 hypothetical protein [Mycobacterium sp. FLAC0960]RAV09717.1 hypothetical protein DQP57_14500 [Mycobacterium colombiense]